MGIFDDITGGIASVTKEATKVTVAPVVAPLVGVAGGLKETMENAWDGVNSHKKDEADNGRS